VTAGIPARSGVDVRASAIVAISPFAITAPGFEPAAT